MAAARKHKRRRSRARFSGLYKLLSVILILAAVVVGCVVFFRVNEVVVTGNSRYTVQEITEVAGVSRQDNLFTINKAQVAKRLRTQLPYITQVSVARKLPDTLILTVTETKAAGMISGEGGWWMMDAGGKLLEQGSASGQTEYFVVRGITPLAPAAGTRLAVAEEERAKLEYLLTLLTAMETEGLIEGADEIDLTDPYQIKIGYDGRFTLVLPTTADFSYRMRFFREALDSGQVADGQKYTVDMTIEGETRFIPG